jgi:FkbM family methyltransferase
MNSLIRSFLKNHLGLRIYRGSLPFGTDLFLDLEKLTGLRSIKTVLDVGANVGQSALRYAEHFPEASIHSFEPVDATFRKLVNNTREMRNITPHKLAMGAETGRALISLHPNSQHNSLLAKDTRSSEEIEVTSIDEFCGKRGIGTVDFLKIDTEGFEFEVLRGAQGMLSGRRIRILQLEAESGRTGGHFANMGDLADYLGPLGYRLFGIFDQYCERGGLLYFNPVFVSGEISHGISGA